MKTHETYQFAYAGQFSVRDIASGQLIHGGGVVAPRPRLYEKAEAAEEAATAITWVDCEAVELVAKIGPLKVPREIGTRHGEEFAKAQISANIDPFWQGLTYSARKELQVAGIAKDSDEWTVAERAAKEAYYAVMERR